MTDYIVVEAFDLRNLTKFVNEKIQIGYIVTGGVCVNTVTNSTNGIPRNYLQSMVKRK